MTENSPMDDGDRLARLDDLVLEEILGQTDDEALADVSTAEVDGLTALFVAAKRAHGQRRLKVAKAAARRVNAVPPPRSSLRRTELPEIATLAARGGRGAVGADQAGIEEDLAELRALQGGEEG